ncbi:MAG: hypothetical protein FJ000_04775, partial [Actinobacteria bacterium]|nr:hypothetical protein [Actinomycetota bacterium]
MTTAFDAMLDLARILGMTEDVATGGSSTTIVCSNLRNWTDLSVDDALNGGTAFIITDAGGLSAAPENETARITDYVESTGTVTVASGDFSAAPAAGDVFGVTPVPRFEMYQALNAALRDLGSIPQEDATLTTAAATREYTIPAAAKKDLRQVWTATRTSRPYDWLERFNWYRRNDTATYDLVFPEQPASGYLIRLVYTAPHAQLKAASTAINNAVPADYLAWKGAYHVYRQRLHRTGKDDKRWTGLMNEAAEYANQAL